MKNRLIILTLSALSGLLLALSWYPIGIVFLIFFAFIPLFFIAEIILNSNMRHPFLKGLSYSLPAFLLWNGITTWWIWNSTAPGAVAAIVLNSLFMALVYAFWIYFRYKNSLEILNPIFFITLWMSFEFLHLHWDLQWPWLNLGNVFAPATPYVQWYSITGTFGGTLWILMINFLVFSIIKMLKQDRKKVWKRVILTLSVWIIPVVVSATIYAHYKYPTTNGIEAVVVQPNTDPYNEQYFLGNSELVERIIETAQPELTNHTALLLTPESSISRSVIENLLISREFSPNNLNYYGITLFDTLLIDYPKLNIIAGLSTLKLYDHAATETAQSNGNGVYIDVFNTAMSYNRKGAVGFYHKSHLVPGVEKMPFVRVLSAIGFDNVVINLGGPRSALGIDKISSPLIASPQDTNLKIGIPICYESVFGEVCSEFVRNGADFLGVITNDAWWKETAGHRQHFIYAKLRAVETRRYLLRAANTGISAIIDPRGDVISQTQYNKRTAIKSTIYPNSQLTFYTKHGDYLARIAVGVLILQILIVLIYKRKQNRI